MIASAADDPTAHPAARSPHPQCLAVVDTVSMYHVSPTSPRGALSAAVPRAVPQPNKCHNTCGGRRVIESRQCPERGKAPL